MPSPNTLALRKRLARLTRTVDVVWNPHQQNGQTRVRHGRRRGQTNAVAYTNPAKDRSLNGKARRRARKAARRG